MKYDRREELKQLADVTATSLLADLKSGLITKIDIVTIRGALKGVLDGPDNADDFDTLEEMTTRRIVARAC